VNKESSSHKEDCRHDDEDLKFKSAFVIELLIASFLLLLEIGWLAFLLIESEGFSGFMCVQQAMLWLLVYRASSPL